MSVIFQSAYSLPAGDQPLTHARIAHSLNWLSGGTATASSTATGYFANAPLNTLTYEKWKPTSATGTWEYDHGSAVECDYCCIGGHTLGASGSTIQIEYWDGAAWVAAGVAPGLVHINTTSFTSAGSVSINNCFSSDYDTYKIVGYYTAKSNLGQDYLRMRVSGSDASSEYYYNNIYTSYTSVTTSNNNGSNVNQIQVSYIASAASGSAFTFDVLNPFLADQTYLFFNSNQGNGISLSAGEHRTATSYDGFTIYPSTGTFTSGIIRVYGYKNS